MTDITTAEEKIAVLKKNYIKLLPQKIFEISSLWQNYKAHNAIIDNELETCLHKLAGSAGLYNQIALGELSRSIELMVTEIDTPLKQQHILILDAALQQLELSITELNLQ